MTWNELIFAIGDIVKATFELLKLAENSVNWFYVVVIAAVLIGWLVMQANFNREAERSGGYK